MLNIKENMKKISPIYYVRESEIHGLSNIFKSRRLFFKFIWMFLFLISTSVCGYYIADIVTNYYSYEFVTTINSKPEPNPKFPVVTLCQYGNKNFEFKIIENTSFFNMRKIKRWQEHFEIFNDSEYGNCYSFNSGRNYYGSEIPIKNISSSGQSYGLKVNLYVETSDKEDFIQLLINIHNQSLGFPNVYNKGYYISSGSFNYFIINKIYENKLPGNFNLIQT
jgi:hypothetical protein